MIVHGSLLAVGLLLLYFANGAYRKTKVLLDTGVKTTANVIDLKVHTDASDNSRTYSTVLQYTDQRRNPVTFESSISSSHPPQIGDILLIIYNPKYKNSVRMLTFWGLYRWTVILLSLATPLLVIGGGYFLFHAL